MTETMDRFLSIEQYLKVEEVSGEKHEYVAGRMYAMSGKSMTHGRIVGNLHVGLRDFARFGRLNYFVATG